MAAWLVRGCDVWINLPRPPLEASGTSGMKNVVNGGLQLSVLDGWWAEGYDGGNGWALRGDVDHDHGAQDARHAHELFRLLEEEVAPEFYRAGRRRHPARLGRPRPPLAAHARAGVRRRADARGLREEGLQGARARDLVRLRRRQLDRRCRRWASASAVAVPSPSGVGVVSGDGVAVGVGVGVTGGGAALRGARVEFLAHLVAEAVQARVELLGDFARRGRRAGSRRSARRSANITATPTSTTSAATTSIQGVMPPRRRKRAGSTGTADRSPRKYARTWDRRAVEARRWNPPCLLAYDALALIPDPDNPGMTATTITEHEADEVSRANATGLQPVVFIHGLWLLPEQLGPLGDALRGGRLHRAHAGLAGRPRDGRGGQRPSRGVREEDRRAGRRPLRGDRRASSTRKPAIIGHSFGGLLTQILAGRGCSAASVAIDPAPFQGVLPLPFSSLKSASPVLRNPANRNRAVPLTYEQFRYAFANAVSEEEAKELYEHVRRARRRRAAVPGRDRELQPVDRGQGRHREPRARAAAADLGREGPHGAVGDHQRRVQEAGRTTSTT